MEPRVVALRSTGKKLSNITAPLTWRGTYEIRSTRAVGMRPHGIAYGVGVKVLI